MKSSPACSSAVDAYILVGENSFLIFFFKLRFIAVDAYILVGENSISISDFGYCHFSCGWERSAVLPLQNQMLSAFGGVNRDSGWVALVGENSFCYYQKGAF